MSYKYILSLTALFFLFSVFEAESQDCDNLKACIGNHLVYSVTSGKSAQYIDVDNTGDFSSINTQMTVEMWFYPIRQAGKLQFIGGYWGPAEDKNDVWCLYIDENDTLKFEIEGGRNRSREDNTIAGVYALSYYDNWHHLAAVFDGTKNTIYVYLDGVLAATAYNPNYPVAKLNKTQNSELSVQFASTNALLNNMNINRTFLGKMDEIRIWNKALTNEEIVCNKDKSLAGTESGLFLYYRANEPEGQFVLCDAAGKGHYGRARSGAHTEKSDRTYNKKLILSSNFISDTLYCSKSKTYTFSLLDSSICGNKVYIAITDKSVSDYFKYIVNGKLYDVGQWSTLVLPSDTAKTFSVLLNADFTGTVKTKLYIRAENNCGKTVADIPISITRHTELDYSLNEIKFDSLKAKCIEVPSHTTVLKICNNTSKTNTPKDITISDLTVKMSDIFKLNLPALPYILAPGDCIDIPVTFHSKDTTALYLDSISVFSDDICSSPRYIALEGKVIEVIKIMDTDSKRLDSIDFGRVCIDYASDAVQYLWTNVLGDDILVESIIVPDQFISKPLKFPIVLKPSTGYRPNYFRFLPTKAGIYNDSIVFVVKSNECTIYKPVYIKGEGYFADIRFETDTLDFGNILVGQEVTLSVKAKNYGNEPFNVSCYLKSGLVFKYQSGTNSVIAPGGVFTVQIRFKPQEDKVYWDNHCYFEQKCFSGNCMVLKGKGILKRFEYNPIAPKIENVLACSSKRDTIDIININSVSEKLINMQFINPSGKFALVSPVSIPSLITLNPNQKYSVIIDYIPNDLTADRSDIASLDYKTEDGEKWSVEIKGASVLPKLSVDPLTQYETIEVGDIRRDTVNIENISNFPITLDSISIGNGFVIISPLSVKGKQLAPREIVQVIIDFVPLVDTDYSEKLKIFALSPCPVFGEGELKGKGVIIPLEMSLAVVSYGFVPPCGCLTRDIPLINRSLVHNMTIDTVYIDSVGNGIGEPELFTWTSYQYALQGNLLPYQIPPKTIDTLKITYCPRSPMIRSLTDNEAVIYVQSSGIGWTKNYDAYLSGKQTIMFEPAPNSIGFPPTPVDTFSAIRTIDISLPPIEYNPSKERVIIDSVRFVPDERVFFASPKTGAFPLIVDSLDTAHLDIIFKPRAVREYRARMYTYISSPCVYTDTTVFVSGIGFAPAYGLSFNFENGKKTPDTLRTTYCDTLEIPLYSSRNIPANIVDIKYRLGIDTSKFKIAGVESEYLSNPCFSYIPSISAMPSIFGGYEITCKNFCYVDSLKPFVIIKLLAVFPDRDTISISADSIKFDTEEVILYHLIAENDFGTVIVLKPDFEILKCVSYDSVQVLDCLTDTLIVRNNGDTPLIFVPPVNLSPYQSLVSSIPNIGDSLNPLDTGMFFIQYCPRKSESRIDTISIFSNLPCSVLYNCQVPSSSFAPKLPIGADFTNNFNKIDTTSSSMGDTLIMPVFTSTDLGLDIKGKKYWLENLSFNTNIDYNPKALKYISTSPAIITRSYNLQNTPGNLKISFSGADSVKQGKIADISFLSIIPDSVYSSIFISLSDFETDSVMFVEIEPFDETGKYQSLGKCGLTTLLETDAVFSLGAVSPNPVLGKASIEFSLKEKTTVQLELFSMDGKSVLVLLENGQELSPGIYKAEFEASALQAGAYYYTLTAGSNRQSRQLLKIR